MLIHLILRYRAPALAVILRLLLLLLYVCLLAPGPSLHLIQTVLLTFQEILLEDVRLQDSLLE